MKGGKPDGVVGQCRDCYWWFGLRKDGTVRSHGYSKFDASVWCRGSWQQPVQTTTREKVLV